jgi:Na+-translocating ferredoxin:NAD+ oxidoreductase subunit B
MSSEDQAYRTLQIHFNKQPVGFPATKSGAEIRILKRLFTPQEARLALFLDHRPATARQMQERGETGFSSAAELDQALKATAMKGGIDMREMSGERYYSTMPFIVGMYERQLSVLSPEFLADVDAFFKSFEYGREFMAADPPQMRTIPINRSITPIHHVAQYDQIRDIIRASAGPFVINQCICRKAMELRKKPCKKTTRLETCFAMEDMAEMAIRKGSGRQIDKEEALLIMDKNEDDGLVLQPANAQRPNFVCACCGCCCGMLGYQKMLPRPLDFWPSNFQTIVNPEACTGCGTCVKRCQVGAVRLDRQKKRATVDTQRCIGCGVCVPTCPKQALSLQEKTPRIIPPETPEELYERIYANKKNGLQKFLMFIKLALKIKQ